MKKDKIAHIIAGILAASAAGIPVYAETLSLFAGIWSAVLTAFVAGLAKELGDCSNDLNQFDPKDLLFTVLGCVIPVLFIIGLHFGRG